MSNQTDGQPADDGPRWPEVSLPDDRLERFRSDPYADHLNMELVEIRLGYARAEMEAAEELTNFQGYLQGGAIISLADYAFAAASNSHGTSAVALSLHFTFVGRVPAGRRLAAEASEEKLGRRTGLYKLEVKTDDGALVASGQGVVYRQEPAANG